MNLQALPSRRQSLVLAITLSLPVVLAVLAFPTPMFDTRELVAWGRHFPLVTPDHPPLMAWIGGAVERLFGLSAPAMIAVNQLLMAIGLAYFYAVLRLMLAPAAASLFTLLYGASFYMAIGPLSFALNADILQLTSWPAVVYYGLRALDTDRIGHWIGLGIWAALALLTKYNAIVLLLGMGVATLVTVEFRTILRRPGLYLAVALTAALVSVHVIAVLQHGGAVAYGLAQFDVGDLPGRLRSLGQLLLGDIALLMPGLVVIAIGTWRGFFVLNRDPLSREQRFLLIMNATMQVVLFALVLFGGLNYVFRYSAPYVMMGVLGLAPLLEPAGGWRNWAERELVFTLGGLYVATGLVIAVIYLVFASHGVMQEPTAAGARALLADWDRTYGCGPAYFLGGRQEVYGIGTEAGIPTISFPDLAATPWFDRARLKAGGAIVVDKPATFDVRMLRFLPGVELLLPQRQVTIPMLRTRTADTTTYYYRFIAPQSCGDPNDIRRARPSS